MLVVGMDAAGAMLPLARSRIYRAISRAQLQCSVINELVPGGWLEFISRTKLDGAAFDRDAEEKLRNRSAASSMLDKNEATAASFEQSEAESSAAVSPLLAEEGGFDRAKEAKDRDPSLFMSTHEHSSTLSITVYPSLLHFRHPSSSSLIITHGHASSFLITRHPLLARRRCRRFR